MWQIFLGGDRLNRRGVIIGSAMITAAATIGIMSATAIGAEPVGAAKV